MQSKRSALSVKREPQEGTVLNYSSGKSAGGKLHFFFHLHLLQSADGQKSAWDEDSSPAGVLARARDCMLSVAPPPPRCSVCYLGSSAGDE